MKDILREQIKIYQTKEEKSNHVREFLQELILQIIDRRGYFKYLAFVGGTALRFLYGLDRFSEDLDFSLVKPRGFHFPTLLAVIQRELALQGYEIESARGKEKVVLSEFLRFKGLLHELGLSSQKNEKLFIKIEIDSNPPAGFETEVILVNKSFMFKLQAYQLSSLFAAKLHAVLFRKFEKGRDYYDLLWFLTNNTPINYRLLSNAAHQTHQRKDINNLSATVGALQKKIQQVDFRALLLDVRPFLANLHEAEYFNEKFFCAALDRYAHRRK